MNAFARELILQLSLPAADAIGQSTMAAAAVNLTIQVSPLL